MFSLHYLANKLKRVLLPCNSPTPFPISNKHVMFNKDRPYLFCIHSGFDFIVVFLVLLLWFSFVIMFFCFIVMLLVSLSCFWYSYHGFGFIVVFLVLLSCLWFCYCVFALLTCFWFCYHSFGFVIVFLISLL